MWFASGFSWFSLIPALSDKALLSPLGLDQAVGMFPGVEEGSYLILHTWLAVGVITLVAVIGRLGLESAKRRAGLDAWMADERVSPRNLAEIFVEGISGMMSDVLAHRDVRLFFPFIGGLFAYILTCNLFGLVPGLLPPTSDISTNVGMAIASFLVFVSVGLARDPVGFVKHLFGPVLLIAPLMLLIESIGLLARPLSLTIRLTGNLFGDHMVFSVFSDMVPIGVPAIFLGLAIVVSFIQAFVFSLLSTVYIGLSLPHTDDHH